MPSSTPRNEGAIPKPASGWRKLAGVDGAHSAGWDMTFSAPEIGLGIMGRLRGA
jgi:hypothetical protein